MTKQKQKEKENKHKEKHSTNFQISFEVNRSTLLLHVPNN